MKFQCWKKKTFLSGLFPIIRLGFFFLINFCHLILVIRSFWVCVHYFVNIKLITLQYTKIYVEFIENKPIPIIYHGDVDTIK